MINQKPIMIEQYNEEWPIAFHTIESILLDRLNGLALRIEHVGSTSVPGLAAKPIIDIDVVIESMEHLPKVIKKLEELGYIHEGDLGIRDREAFARKDVYVPFSIEGSVKHEHHLYVCKRESEELIRHIMFRDALRKYPSLVSEYTNLKLQLSNTFRNNRNAYTEGKTGFITKVMREYRDVL
ncbi:GrpB family protein [Paenibacillus sp. SC116]|uniref:GrpB family protein n=1 Tax=Paenibacillus sp. SC116 TaxID=2968986 RepID=UPI00215B4D5B|nr:GrpB family protein [Paenibacillus sp. SC116]MCR8845643.1 GrpB family protein [Paenibacillus sp. SC116]